MRCVGAEGLGEHRDPILIREPSLWRIVAAARPDGGDRNHLVVYTFAPLR